MPLKTPQAIVEAACAASVAKVRLSTARTLVLGFFAGAYIALGGVVAMVIGKDNPALAAANPGLAKLVFAAVFPVGIMMVVINGAELFTGNTGIMLPGCLSRRTPWRAMLRNWGLVYVGNLAGSLFVAAALAWSGLIRGAAWAGGGCRAEAKVGLGWGPLILRAPSAATGWCCWASGSPWPPTTSSARCGGSRFPIMAFVAIGFEHSVANMFFIPLGMLNGADVSVGQFLWNNLLPVTLGNIVGGSGWWARSTGGVRARVPRRPGQGRLGRELHLAEPRSLAPRFTPRCSGRPAHRQGWRAAQPSERCARQAGRRPA